jgi:cephalosporin hydroxylase
MVEHYSELFGSVLSRFRPRRMLEVGVCRGGSLALWMDFFGCEVLGIDSDLSQVTPVCRSHYDENPDTRLFEMTMPDPRAAELGPFDLVIDDGGHGYGLTRSTLELLWSQVSLGGVYVIEDWRLSRFEPSRLLAFLAEFLIGNESSEYAMGNVPVRLVVYRELIAIEKTIGADRVERIDPTL